MTPASLAPVRASTALLQQLAGSFQQRLHDRAAAAKKQVLEEQLAMERLRREGERIAQEQEAERRCLQEMRELARRNAAATHEAAAASAAAAREREKNKKAQERPARQTEKETLARITHCPRRSIVWFDRGHAQNSQLQPKQREGC